MYDLLARTFSTVAIQGGSIGGVLVAFDSNTVTVYGTGFNYPYGILSVTSGTVTGTLQDGTQINNSFRKVGNGEIILVPSLVPEPPSTVPEPYSLALLTLGGVTLADWRRWKKRRPTA